MPIERLHWKVLNLKRVVQYGTDRGKLTEVTNKHSLNVAINDSREIQLGTIGKVLQWTPLSRFSLALATEEEATVVETGTKKHTSVRKATVKDAFPWAEFEMVIEWDVSQNW